MVPVLCDFIPYIHIFPLDLKRLVGNEDDMRTALLCCGS
jgi:hypothetical protein